MQTPSLAARLADLVGTTPAAAYDLNAACAGYCYAVAQADALVRTGVAVERVVVRSREADASESVIAAWRGRGGVARSTAPSA